MDASWISSYRARPVLAIFLLLTCKLVTAQQILRPVDQQSTIRFTIKNFGLRVDGSLRGINGTIIFNPDNPQEGKFEVTLKSASVSTGNTARDNHLRKEDYLDVVRYPVVHFLSTQITQDKQTGTYLVKGYLTMKGKRKAISIPFRLNKKTEGTEFTGSFTINRRDFDVGGQSISLSDNLTISLAVLCR